MGNYLLFGGLNYYPSGGWGDFISSYPTLEEAQDVGASGVGDAYDWYQVVDLSYGGYCCLRECSMVKQVVRWETEDGQVFDTQEAATEHEWREHRAAVIRDTLYQPDEYEILDFIEKYTKGWE